MLEHGGGIIAAAGKFNIPLSDWIDLSTGVNPESYPLPPIAPFIWRSLPQDEDGLLEVAASYYGSNNLLPVAGSQAAIQALPFMRPQSKVGVLHPTYAEHAYAWKKCGHELQHIHHRDFGAAVRDLDVLIVCNPNNPTGELFDIPCLLDCCRALVSKGGWLIVDEAFIDVEPDHSLMTETGTEGLIVLRSLGKFFGLAGARVGFVGAWGTLLNELKEYLGPWSISGPSRLAAQYALADTNWQSQIKDKLRYDSKRLAELLRQYGFMPKGSTHFFQWISDESAHKLHSSLGTKGILTRYFAEPPSLRFGLPATEEHWQRLENCLSSFEYEREHQVLYVAQPLSNQVL